MPDFENTLIVGISSRTLFDLEEEDKLFNSTLTKSEYIW